MRPNTAVKYSLLFILLALGQEFSSAYRIHHPISQRGWAVDVPQDTGFKTPTFSEPLQYGEDFKEVQEKRSENTTDVEVVTPEKRWVAAVTLGISVGIALGGIAFEVWLKLEKCCGPFPETCRYRDEGKKIQKRLLKLFPKVDFLALTAKNLLEDVTQINYRLIEIWNDMKRIRDLKVRLLTQISAETIKSFNTKWAAIEQQLRHANETVRKWTYKQINVEFNSYLNDYKTALLGFTPLFSYALALAAIPAYNAYKQRSLNKEIAKLSTGESYKQLVNARHTKAAKILGVQNINSHIKSTAKSRIDSRFKTGKYTKLVNGISIASTAISLGVEIYSAIQKIEQCRTVRDEAKKGYDDMVSGEKTLKGVHKNVTEYIDLVDKEGFQYTHGQLSSEDVLAELEAIRKLAKSAGKQSKNMTNAAKAIDEFIINIKDANSDKTLNISAALADALAGVKFLYICYNSKVSLVNFVVGQCKNGSGSVESLFASGIKHFDTQAKECRNDAGVPYFNLDDMKVTLNKRATEGNFSTDCIVNSVDKKDKVCRMYNVDKYNKTQIQKKEGMTPSQVDQFLSKCQPSPLTPANEASICFARGLGLTNKQIYNNKNMRKALPRSVTLKQIEAVTCSKR